MKTVITYGTFDLFHEGHYNIIKRAREYGDYLIVGVTGEDYDLGRGKLSVKDTLATRIENVKNTGLVDKIIVEEYLGQKINDILKYNVDKFVIGDDWKGKFDHLNRYCDVIYLERTAGISSTQIREEKFATRRLGIVTDDLDDNLIVNESKSVKNLLIDSVYSEDRELVKAFSEKYGIAKPCNSYMELIEGCDIVYVRTETKRRLDYVKLALENKRHVICDYPITFSGDEMASILELARSNNVVLMPNVKMLHMSVYNQLLWMTHGDIVGDILSLSCSISKNDKKRNNIFYDLLSVQLVQLVKIMGTDFKSLQIDTVSESDALDFARLLFTFGTGSAVITAGNKIRVKNQFEIIGTKGTIRGGDYWWRGNRFEIDFPDEDYAKTYNTNYSGNGFKYLLKDLLLKLESGNYRDSLLNDEEQITIANIYDQIVKA